MKEIFLQISSRQDLSQDQVQAVFDRILKNEVSESQIAAFLMGLKTKGETADEITGIVRALKSHATVLPETSQMLCVTVELVGTSLIASTFRQRFVLF